MTGALVSLGTLKLRTTMLACLAALAVWSAPAVAMACPFCKEVLGSNGENIMAGYFYSILFMLSMPFLTFGGIAGYFYLLVRRARAERQTDAASAHAEHRAGMEEPVGV